MSEYRATITAAADEAVEYAAAFPEYVDGPEDVFVMAVEFTGYEDGMAALPPGVGEDDFYADVDDLVQRRLESEGN